MMDNAPAIELYMVRHAEASHNLRPQVINGQSLHAALSPQGVVQADELGKHLRRANMQPDLILSSPARRCRQTAAFALMVMGCEMEPVFDERLVELDQGEWEGQLRDEIYDEATLERIRREQMDFSAPGGESINRVAERQMELMGELPQRLSHNGEPRVILGFGHGLATRILAGKLLGWSMDEMRREITPNTSVTLFTHSDGNWGVEYIGKPPAELE